MVADPDEIAETSPDCVTVATPSFDDDQATVFSVALSGRTVAISVSFAPFSKESAFLLSEIEETAIDFCETVTVHDAVFPSTVALICAEPAEIA